MVGKMGGFGLFGVVFKGRLIKCVIAVIVENAGSGSSKAAPLAKAVLDLYFEKQTKTKH
jgi:cell division protein FtsI/penicillin-binding protein 2